MLVRFDPLDALSTGAPGGLPWPATLFGAVKSFLLRQHGLVGEKYRSQKRHEALTGILATTGNRWERGTLKLLGPFFVKGASLIVPCPQGLVLADGNTSFLSPYKDVGSKDCPVWVRNAREIRPLNVYLTQSGLERYLAGTPPEAGDYVSRESLFSIEGGGKVIRYVDGVGLGCWVEGVEPSLLKNMLIPLGGKRRYVASSILDSTPPGVPKLTEGRFKLVFLSPAVFAHGWRPRWLSQDGNAAYGSLRARLVSFICRGPVRYAGWDLTHSEPRRLRALVPAGSEYLFELVSGDISELHKALHLHALSDRQAQAGFGVSVIGTWRYI